MVAGRLEITDLLWQADAPGAAAVELVGIDVNPVLVEEAGKLAGRAGLRFPGSVPRPAGLAWSGALGWRQRYLASAVILGPLTLLRPVAAIAGGTLGAVAARDPVVAVCTAHSVTAGLAVEPAAGRRWHTQARAGRPPGASSEKTYCS
jgi:hypothetical protein